MLDNYTLIEGREAQFVAECTFWGTWKFLFKFLGTIIPKNQEEIVFALNPKP